MKHVGWNHTGKNIHRAVKERGPDYQGKGENVDFMQNDHQREINNNNEEVGKEKRFCIILGKGVINRN